MDIQIRPHFEWPVYHRYRLEEPDPGVEYIDPPFGGYKIVPDSEAFDWKEPLENDPNLPERFADLYENPSADKFLEFARAFGTLEIPNKGEPYSDLGHWWMMSSEIHSWVVGSWQAENELAEAMRSRIEQTGKTVLKKKVDEGGRTWRLIGPARAGFTAEEFEYLTCPERKIGLLIGNLMPLLDHDLETGKMRFSVAPQSLLSAMALQLVHNFGPKSWRQCPNCSMHFPVGPGTGNRKNRIYCSDSCRYQDRDRKKKRT